MGGKKEMKKLETKKGKSHISHEDKVEKDIISGICNKKSRKNNTIKKCGRRKRAHKKSETLKAKVYSINNVEVRNERLKTFIDNSKWDHLMEKEKGDVEYLVSETQDLFHLPGEKLTCTSILKHWIRTTDDKPIHVK